MSANCRDCNACTRSALWRLMIVCCVTWWLGMFKMVVKTCPQCHHVLGKHARRADGSFCD
jgi:hypothetical protein